MPDAIVYLARHATPDWSRRDIRYDVPPGPPLTPQGQAEARLLGQFFQEAGITRLYASPLERTRHTAALAAEVAGIPVFEEEAIAEWRLGESAEEVLNRFRAFWEEACAESARRGPIGLVTHGGPIRVLLEELGVDRELLAHYQNQFDNRNPLPPAGVWLTRSAHGQDGWHLELVFAPQQPASA